MEWAKCRIKKKILQSLILIIELTWLDFNQRVLLESINETMPLLEKLNFLSIASSNLDEFFRIRVGGLHTRVRMNYLKVDSKTGLDQLNFFLKFLKES